MQKTERQLKLAKRRKVERRRKIRTAGYVIGIAAKAVTAFVATTAFLVTLVANIEQDPDRFILIFELTAGYVFCFWALWFLFIRKKA